MQFFIVDQVETGACLPQAGKTFLALVKEIYKALISSYQPISFPN